MGDSGGVRHQLETAHRPNEHEQRHGKQHVSAHGFCSFFILIVLYLRDGILKEHDECLTNIVEKININKYEASASNHQLRKDWRQEEKGSLCGLDVRSFLWEPS